MLFGGFTLQSIEENLAVFCLGQTGREALRYNARLENPGSSAFGRLGRFGRNKQMGTHSMTQNNENPQEAAAEETASIQAGQAVEAGDPATAAASAAAERGEDPAAPMSFDVVLASASPRRKQLLEEAGVKFTVRMPVTPVDESLEPDLLADPTEACKKLAERKAGAVVQEVLAEDYTGMLIVIGADTMVVKDGVIFGKPRSLSDGKHMLRELSACTHEVVTAVSVWMIAAPEAEKVSLGFRTFADTSLVTFRELSDEEIADYLRKGESFDKAGAYAIQGEGAKLVEHVHGDIDTVIGLPAQRLIREFPDLVQG